MATTVNAAANWEDLLCDIVRFKEFRMVTS
jgi:hypothetical protein